ncbi:unnamed protein product [Orchesella dallaii]|uniref:Uncharacterized protein n=1 Tax=Orchesella dallaii TaxID=48710 RepID=A0ABP1RQF2_9HEXA
MHNRMNCGGLHTRTQSQHSTGDRTYGWRCRETRRQPPNSQLIRKEQLGVPAVAITTAHSYSNTKFVPKLLLNLFTLFDLQ